MKAQRFAALDGWRGLAAAVVALTHLSAAGHFYELPIVRHGGLAVPFFFVLSGFVISHAYGAGLSSGGDLRRFITRRVGRLYPLHFATLMALVGLECLKLAMVSAGVKSGQPPFSGSNDVVSLVANLFLLEAVVPMGEYTWNGPSWSISTEFYTYLVYAAIVMIAAAKVRSGILAAFLLTGGALFVIEFSGLEIHKTSGLGLLQCIFGFFGGVLTHQLYRRLADAGVRSNTLLELAGFGAVVALFWYDPSGHSATVLPFMAVVLVFALEGGVVSRFLKLSPFQVAGELSYSVYLNHFVILSVLSGFLRASQSVFDVQLLYPANDVDMISLGPKPLMDLLAVGYLVAVGIVSVFTYRFIEQPGRSLFNRWADRMSSKARNGTMPTPAGA